MSEEKEVLGKAAETARAQKESLAKILGNVSDVHQLIVISTDLSGKTATHIHIQGPSADKVLLYGMLEVARDVVNQGGTLK